MAETLLPSEKEHPQMLVKTADASTDDRHGTYPEKRAVLDLMNYGIVNVDKQEGPTSHQVAEYVQKILNIAKAGHSGTLDPHVTGCLPVALGRATRVVSALLPAGKEYVCIMHVHAPVSGEHLREVCKAFTGTIRQLPPLKSAVKREWRDRTIYYLVIHETDGQDVLFTVGCEAGTYIRKLCTDIGEKLGCGAHMSELRRTKAGPFHADSSVSLTDLADAFAFFKEDHDEQGIRSCILPFERAVEHLPKIHVLDTTIDTLCHGAALNIPGIAKLTDNVETGRLTAVLSLKGELIGLGEAMMDAKEVMRQERGCVMGRMKIFMDEGTYPKFEKA